MNLIRMCTRVAILIGTLLTASLFSGCAGHVPKPEKTASASSAYQYYSLGTIAMTAGDYASAAAAFENALRLDPASSEIRFSLAECYFTMHQLDRAIAVASVLQPQDARALELLGKYYRYGNREEQAGDVYRRLVTIDTANAEAYWYLSRLALRRGNAPEAAADLIRAARLRGDSRLYAEAGDLYGRAGQLEEAAHAFEESIRRDSTVANRNAFLGLAQTYESLGRGDDARAVYRRAIERVPPDPMPRRLLIDHFLFHEQPDSAIAEIQQLLAMDPTAQREKIRLGILWYNTDRQEKAESLFTSLQNDSVPYIPLYYLGRIAFDKRNYPKAKDYFRQAVALEDTIPDAWVQLGNTLLSQDSLAAAVSLGEKAAGIVSDPRPLWYFLGVAYSRHERYDSAVVWFERTLAQDSSDTRVRFALASSLERGGQFDRAAAAFNELLLREPENAPALNYLGYMYADSGVHLDESLRLIQKAVEREPENGAYLDSYGWVLFRLKRYPEAEAQLRKALNTLQSDATLHDHLGDILAAQGKHEDATQEWRRALEIDPENQELKTKLGQ